MMIDRTTEHGAAAPAVFTTAGLSAADLSDLLGLVYQGVSEATPWGRFLEAMRARLDANFVTLVLRSPASNRPGLIVNASVYGALLPGEPSYSEHYYALCPFHRLPLDEVLSADLLFGADAWLQHAFYLQYLRPLDLRYTLATNIRTDNGVECAFFVSRRHATHDYDEAERALVRALLPHLKRAVDLHAQRDVLESERQLYEDAMDRMLVGTAILDETGKVIKHNGAAGRLFAAKDGVYVADRTLRAHCPLENRRLQQLVQSALADHLSAASACAEAIVLSRPRGEVPLSLLIKSIPLSYCAEIDRQRPAVAVFIRDPNGSPASRQMLRRLFQLTPAETEIALLLADGCTLDEAADQLGIKKNTARAHLRGVFAKTGATRQAMLVKTLLNSVVSMA